MPANFFSSGIVTGTHSTRAVQTLAVSVRCTSSMHRGEKSGGPQARAEATIAAQPSDPSSRQLVEGAVIPSRARLLQGIRSSSQWPSPPSTPLRIFC